MEVKEIVSAAWLHAHLGDEKLIILDASLAQTATGKTPASSTETIPNTRYFDLKNTFSDPESAFPNTLPTPEHFETECQKLGINSDSKIVVFDNLGVYSSPRVWWMFQVMGQKKVYVLDGGLPEWKAQGFEVEERRPLPVKSGNFKVRFNPELLATYEEVLTNTLNKTFKLVDARSAGRFKGTQPEPRKHLQSGSITHSINIPYTRVLENGKFKNKAALQRVFDAAVESDAPLVFSCGSGVTACIVMLAYEIAGYQSMRIYDGSWTEWAELQNLKTEL